MYTLYLEWPPQLCSQAAADLPRLLRSLLMTLCLFKQSRASLCFYRGSYHSASNALCWSFVNPFSTHCLCPAKPVLVSLVSTLEVSGESYPQRFWFNCEWGDLRAEGFNPPQGLSHGASALDCGVRELLYLIHLYYLFPWCSAWHTVGAHWISVPLH